MTRAMLILAMASCASVSPAPREVRFVGSAAGRAELDAAAAEWSAKCGVDLVRVDDAAAYVVREVDVGDAALPETPLGEADGFTSPAGMAVAVAAPRAVYAHELGHLLGLGHKPDGVMRMPTSPAAVVGADDCADVMREHGR